MQDSKAFVAKYVTDQLVLVQHSLKVLESQAEDSDAKNQPQVASLLSAIISTLSKHEMLLKSHLERYFEEPEHSIGAQVSEAFTSLTGTVIGLYNNIRTEKVSKMLRDDYTVLCLGTLTYSMLLTTSRSLNYPQTAELACELMIDYPPLVTKLSEIIPYVVNDDLLKRGFEVKSEAATEAIECSKRAWSNG